MRMIGLGLVLLLAGTPAAAQPASSAPVEALENAQYSPLPKTVGRQEPFLSWEKRLRGALAGRKPEVAARALAPGSGLTPAQMQELVTLWLGSQAHSYDRSESRTEAFRRAFRALAAATGRNRLVLQAAAAFEGGDLRCREGDFDALLEGAGDRAAEAWTLIDAAHCTEWYRQLPSVAPAQSGLALLMLAEWGPLYRPHGLAGFAWLTSPEGLAYFKTSQPEALHARIASGYLRTLVRAGLIEDAAAYYQGLPPAIRGKLLQRARPAAQVSVGAMSATIEGDDDSSDLAGEIVSALALTGRKDEAERLFARLQGPEKARRALACSALPERQARLSDCEFDWEDRIGRIVLLDHLLHGGTADPYPVAELIVATPSGDSSDGLGAALKCRVFAEPALASLCADARKSAAYFLSPYPSDEENRAAVAAALSALHSGAGTIETWEAKVRSALAPGGGPDPQEAHRISVDPLPPPFEERPIPAGLPVRAKQDPKGLASLPEGYAPVRVEVSGSRAVAISLSQNYDPTGEVSGGGYWVHLSEDGGKSWQRPLYTGLADRFPYVALPESPLPLLDGDVVNLAADVNLLDTASITYPPVALRAREKRSGVYLRIPLDALRRDSDEDGLTDLAARHLLLDPESRSGGTPVRLGGDVSACTPERAAAQEPVRLLIEQIFSGGTGAIIEPLDRKDDLSNPWQGMLRLDANSVDRPILLQGDPRDFSCLRTRRLTVVYSVADIARLNRMSPDFHAVEIGKFLFNRARDRGFVSWSNGWAGGTVRFRRTKSGWKMDTISSWIS